MKALALRPATHGSFGIASMTWKTSKKLVPKDLDHAQLQVCLFQRACVQENSSSEEDDNSSDEGGYWSQGTTFPTPTVATLSS